MKFLYGIQDVKSSSFVNFIVADSDVIIKRGFISCLASDSDLSRFPEDFSLFRLGSVNDSTGFLSPEMTPVLIMTAVEALKSLSTAASGFNQAGSETEQKL
ncbi:nonstructural protein [Capybara microvirus Cap3_SP_578]|nr:nonstructural protein [Capybara microvirus Cap3_SP_578]